MVAAAACAALSRGYFLSDDFAQLAVLGHWDAGGSLVAEVARRFAQSMDGVNGFYRPLTLFTFAASYLLGGGKPGGWLAVNLGLHLANAVLAGALVLALSRPRRHAARIGALAAAVLFFVLSPGWEVAMWVVCRYDALATLFTLAAGLAFLRGRAAWALLAGIAALLSKESGAVAIVLVAVLAAADEIALDETAGAGERAARWLRRMAPWIVLGAAYAALRFAMFGSATRVYAGPPMDLGSLAHWRALAASASAWALPVFPGRGGAPGMLALSALVLAAGLALAARRDRGALAHLGAMLAALGAALALFLPHLGGFEGNGIGGRLFYQASAFYAIAIGLAIREAGSAWTARPLAARALALAGACLLALHAGWGWDAARGYLRVERSMRALASALPRLAGGGDDFALVIVPDAVGRVAFGRNAQAGLVLPPVQARPLSGALLVQTDREVGGLDRVIDAGLLGALRARPLFDVMENRAGPGPWPRVAPTAVYCWNAQRRAMERLEVDASAPGTVSVQVARGYAARCAPAL